MLRIESTSVPGNRFVVTLDGEINSETAHELEVALNRLSAQRPAMVLFDFANVTFVGSLGMGMLVSYARGLARGDGVVRLATLRPDVRDAFDRARLGEVLPLVDSVEAALAEEAAA